MDRTYWQRQDPSNPLFPDLIWSRPETKAGAGKLLIVGGNAHGFAAPAEAVSYAEDAGVGLIRVVLPSSVKRLLPRGVMEVEFAPGTPSGSFARSALAEVCDTAAWSDGVLLAGDFGRNSETAIMLEQFVTKYTGQLTVTQDAAEYFIKLPAPILARPESLLVISFAQAQKLFKNARFPTALMYDMDFMRLVDALHEFTTTHHVHIITKHHKTLFVAVNGEVSTTQLIDDLSIWRVRIAASAATWWLQNPSKPYIALSSSLIKQP